MMYLELLELLEKFHEGSLIRITSVTFLEEEYIAIYSANGQAYVAVVDGHGIDIRWTKTTR